MREASYSREYAGERRSGRVDCHRVTQVVAHPNPQTARNASPISTRVCDDLCHPRENLIKASLSGFTKYAPRLCHDSLLTTASDYNDCINALLSIHFPPQLAPSYFLN